MSDHEPNPRNTFSCPLCRAPIELVADGVERVHKCAGLQERQNEAMIRYIEFSSEINGEEIK